jgi:hypothetical protein
MLPKKNIRWCLMKAKMLLLRVFLSSHQLISILRKRATISMRQRSRGSRKSKIKEMPRPAKPTSNNKKEM